MSTDVNRIFLIVFVFLTACADSRLPLSSKDLPMIPIAQLKEKLSFTCVHELIPTASADSDVLFNFARWLQKNNLLKRDKAVNMEIERLYRIAAGNGNFKAMINLQNGGMSGQFRVLDGEYLSFSQDLIDANVATGYYLISLLLEKGGAGLQQDSDMALRYLSKAANTGSAHAQFFIGEKLEPTNVAPQVAMEMFRCAADQGHGEAAVVFGIHHKIKQEYNLAAEQFQRAVAYGDEGAANRLANAFSDISSSNQIYYLSQRQDLERAQRYKKIWRILANYSYANPKVPEINDIVPLPPAELPEWDGTLKWLEERKANIPPPKPSEALINTLADAAKLERATGRPMPGAKGFSQQHLSVPYDCETYGGKVCPVSGYWRVETYWGLYTPDGRPIIRYIAKGQIFPAEQMIREKPRSWLRSPERVQLLINVRWYLA